MPVLNQSCGFDVFMTDPTVSETVDDTPDDELREVPGEKLQDGSSSTKRCTNAQSVLTTQLVSKGSRQKTSDQITKL